MYGRTPPPLSVVRSAPSADDDASLAAALIARDRDAPTLAWTRLSPLVLRLLRRYFGPGPDRQDLCQEVFMRFFSRIDELRDRSALRSFLIGICLGVAQNELRRAKVRRWIFLTQSGDLPDAPINGTNPEAREATERVYKILAGVSAEDRALFVTRYIEKMELAEIAEAVGRPLSTTKRRLARATRRIAARMSGDPALADYVAGMGKVESGESVMKVGDVDREIEREQHMDALGGTIAETIGPPAPGAAGVLPDDVARALTRRPRRRLRAVWKLAPVLALGMGVAAFFMLRTQPLEYQLSGNYAARDDGFETPGNGSATAQFSDGTSIAVGARSAARVRSRTRAGATIRLERGRASFAVVHRPGARWNVEVGPFEIAVTGTEFDVHWSDDRDGFEVIMKSGTVVVRGSLTGAGIPLHAGQRLVASLTDKTLSVSEASQTQRRTTAPAAPEVVAPRDEPPAPRRARQVAQVAPDIRLHAQPPAESPETSARLRGLTPPPFEPSPPAPAPATRPAQADPQMLVGTALGVGGANCGARPQPQIRFERADEGFRVLNSGSSAVFTNPVIDHSYSWCGGGSLRFDSSFDLADTSFQSGEAVVFLPHPIDLRGKTVTLRFMVRGSIDAEFSARILAGQGDKRTGNSYNPHLTTGTWWTISATFHEAPTGFGTFQSNVHATDRVILKVDATGTYRVWSGPIYIDDISWR